MKIATFSLLLFMTLRNGNGDNNSRRLSNEQKNTTDGSFQVNVSAGYGVHSDNNTAPTLPKFQYNERKMMRVNDSEQIFESSRKNHEMLPLPAYQVYEQPTERYDKNQIERPNKHRYRSIEQKLRPLTNEYEQQKLNSIKNGNLGSSSKIVEVLRVPAIYELHLQSDPQRIVSLNPSWTNKFNDVGVQNYLKKSSVYQFNGGKNLFPQFSNNFNNYRYKVPPLKPTLINNYFGLNQLKPNYKITRNPIITSETYKNFASQTQNQFSNEISTDNYQKPQALHEVPPPVLNQPVRHLSKMKTTSTPTLVYGKPIDQSISKPNPWETKPELLTHSNFYTKAHVDTIPDFYQHYYRDKPQAHKIHDYNLGQHYFNEAIGDYLDHSLVNVNGGISTYMNNDGTMTVSNFDHNPKLIYQDDPDVPSKLPQGFTNPYNPPDFAPFEPQGFAGYNDISVTEPSTIGSPEHSNDLDLLLEPSGIDTSLSKGNEMTQGHKFDPVGIYDDGSLAKRMNYARPFKAANRRMEPMNYILFINERTID